MELDMATIVLKDIPVELQKRLEERTWRNGRSVNREVIACLEGGRSDVAECVVDRDPEWAAPLLARSEFRNVLAIWMRRGVHRNLVAEKGRPSVIVAAGFSLAAAANLGMPVGEGRPSGVEGMYYGGRGDWG